MNIIDYWYHHTIYYTIGIEREELHILYCRRAMLCRPGGGRHADREQNDVANRAEEVWRSLAVARDEVGHLHLRWVGVQAGRRCRGCTCACW